MLVGRTAARGRAGEQRGCELRLAEPVPPGLKVAGTASAVGREKNIMAAQWERTRVARAEGLKANS